jgi:hypothetical protein
MILLVADGEYVSPTTKTSKNFELQLLIFISTVIILVKKLAGILMQKFNLRSE